MKPILFSTPMVQAILDGRKTMTIRICNIPDGWEYDGYGRITSEHPKKGKFGAIIRKGVGTDFPEVDIVPAKYQVCDVLWVRETFGEYYPMCNHGNFCDCEPLIVYKAGKNHLYDIDCIKKWKPSIFMPKEACRIFLRVTNVMVERLQDISEEDCLSEGIYESDDNDCTGKYKAYTIKKPNIQDGIFIDDKFNSAYEAFECLWNSINGKGAWEANPYVFVYEFERIKNVK